MVRNKIYKGLTKTTVAAVLMAGIIAPSMAQAANGDYYLNGVNKGNAVKIISDGGIQAYANVMTNSATLYEADGKLYKLNEVATFLDQNQNITSLTQLYTGLSNSTLVGEPLSPPTSLTVSGVYTGGLMSYVDVAMNQFTSNIDKIYVDGVELPKTQYSFVNNGSTLRIVQVTKASQIQVKLVGQNDKIQVVF